MPVIKIDEIEYTSFSPFDATENVALIPMVYVRNLVRRDSEGAIYEELPAPTLLSNALTFKNKWRYHFSYLEYITTVEEDGTELKVVNKETLDKTYFMIYELLLQGMRVIIAPIDGGTTDVADTKVIDRSDIVEKINKYISDGGFEKFKDRNLYNIKFITSGAYENINVEGMSSSYEVLKELAAARGDAVALLEMPEDKVSISDIYNITKGITDKDYKFAAITFPWCQFTTSADGAARYKTLPASFAYLMAYANSVKTNANWFAAAGTVRGLIPNLIAPKVNIGEAMMHWLQNDAEDYSDEYSETLQCNINPVYNAGAYGYRLWGNKVAWKKTDAESSQYLEYLNVRVLMCDIKKQIYHAAMRVTFEPNDDIVWYNFKSLANTLLDRMKSGRGVRWYKWFKEESNEKAVIKATLTIQPIEAVESFDISIILTDQTAEVVEGEE